MSEALRFVPPRVQFVDNRGFISREWYLFLQGVFDRVGGAGGQSNNDLVQDMPDDAGLEEVKAALYSTSDGLNQSPTAVFINPADMLAPPLVETQQVDQLQAELAQLRDTVTELVKTVQGLQQGVII